MRRGLSEFDGTDQVKSSAQDGFPVARTSLQRFHSIRQSRSRSIVAPYKFVPLKAFNSSEVKWRGVLSFSVGGRVFI